MADLQSDEVTAAASSIKIVDQARIGGRPQYLSEVAALSPGCGHHRHPFEQFIQPREMLGQANASRPPIVIDMGTDGHRTGLERSRPKCTC
jgi:hypothetical protein